MRVALRLSRDLIAMRAPADRLAAGQLLRVGDNNTAAVLSSRAGVIVSALLGKAHGGNAQQPAFAHSSASAVVKDADVELLQGRVLQAPLGGRTSLGGRIIDCFGNPLDGQPAPLCCECAIVGTPPVQAQLKPIDRSLHTGTAAIDALAPIGRGQTALIFGQPGTGKSTIGFDALLAQAHHKDVHCVLALSEGSRRGARNTMAKLRQYGDDDLVQRCTIVSTAESPDSNTTGTPSSEVAMVREKPSAESLLVLAAATAAVAESVRDAGACWSSPTGWPGSVRYGTLRGTRSRAWAARLWAPLRISSTRPSSGSSTPLTCSVPGSSCRISAVAHSRYSGPCSRRPRPHSARRPACGASSPSSAAEATFTLDDFAGQSDATKARLAALVARGIALDATTLAKLRIPPPSASTTAAPAASESGASVDSAEPLRERTCVQSLTLDQLQSLTDGHLELQAELFAGGMRPRPFFSHLACACGRRLHALRGARHAIDPCHAESRAAPTARAPRRRAIFCRQVETTHRRCARNVSAQPRLSSARVPSCGVSSAYLADCSAAQPCQRPPRPPRKSVRLERGGRSRHRRRRRGEKCVRSSTL